MDSKPVITYAGDPGLFQDLEAALTHAIPKESTEWRRPYGKVHPSVYVDPTFVPFSVNLILKPDEWKLIDQPVLHTYWIECNDLEVYKGTVKEDIEQWLKSLNGADWMIILIEVYDIRKSNKLLPRTTVLDKIRSDFAAKQGDRVISLIHPIKSESKSAESWRGLVSRIKVLLLNAYNRVLQKYEEAVRAHRECRQQQNWSFCTFFLMQEELALVYEMLGLYEDALIQYDELDALFSQFICSYAKGDHPKWLLSFTVPLQQWAGINLGQKISKHQRDSIKYSKLDLLQFRGYLFGRQSSLLLLLCKPWVMAQRTIVFLHNTVTELKILEVNYPDGAVACWVFLVCLETLLTCDRFNDSRQVEAYSLYTADLRAYARDKLKELGGLCGLLPGNEPSSEQLHTVVGLSSGMGDPPFNASGLTPVDKLKEALSSNEHYNKSYLELSELTIIAYKHIRRLRCARLAGQELAKFYFSLGQYHKATTFLTGSLASFQKDKWFNLAADTQLQLAECYFALNDKQKYAITCGNIASSDLENAARITYFHKFIECLKEIPPEDNFTANIEELIEVISTETADFYQLSGGHCDIIVTMVVNNKLAGPITCSSVSIALVRNEQNKKDSTVQSFNSKVSKYSFWKVPMVEIISYQQDKTIQSVCVHSDQIRELTRSDSTEKEHKIAPPVKSDFNICLNAENVRLEPGRNIVELKWKASETGYYNLDQVSIALGQLELLGPIPELVEFQITEQKSSIELNKGPRELLAGLPQDMELIIHAASYHISQGDALIVRCSRGLTATTSNNVDDEMTRELEIKLPSAMPFQTIKLPIRLLSELPPQKERDVTSVHHTVSLKCAWCEEETSITLGFQPPLKSIFKLHTAVERKFAQITVSGLSSEMLELCLPKLTCNNELLIVKSLNPTIGQPLIIANGFNVSLLWELEVDNLDNDSVKLDFSIDYSLIEDIDTLKSAMKYRKYKCHFDLVSFKTLFVVKCNVEPGKESDYCRVGAMCQLLLEIQKSAVESADVSLMYEVLADQTMWAVLGRAAGVVSLGRDSRQNVALDVMPLAQGYLPLPQVRLSKYIPAVEKESGKETSHPRLEPFSPGQVYSASKSKQVHILPASQVEA